MIDLEYMEKSYAKEYLARISEKFATGQAREHAHRPALQDFFEKISGIKVVNDPKRSEYGSPDFIFYKGKITIAYAETKDIGAPLDKVEKGEQLMRYYGYSNLILTDYLEFRFYRNGDKYCEPIKIGELKNGKIIPEENNFGYLEQTIHDFINASKEPIKSGAVLAKVMAARARRICDNIRIFLANPEDKKNENLIAIYNVIKKLLLADLDYGRFADMYAQTVVYGLFAARYNDPTAENFTRQEARDLVPVSNPFLKEFFNHIAGSSFDVRLEVIVNELCEEFGHADVQAIVHDYYKVEKEGSRDPIIHFYEDFLKFYDPKARLDLGVFYTPAPVVGFIVRSLDEILKNNFGLAGLADSSKIEIQKTVQDKKAKLTVHKVQILDPATGTGTFLNEVINQAKKSFAGQEGRWPAYVKDDLLPRLHGFEIMMASYTIAHLKLSTTLKESGADLCGRRLNVFLTNSLEKEDRPEANLFNYHLGLEKAITDESREANKVKNDLPIMVILGNPPYSGESMNPNYKDNDVYKLEPGTTEKLKERNSKWLNDDYVKFIRLAESLIEKTSEGIIGMITAHGYLDNPTFRGMRYHLMQTFNKLYILDLHGNANKKETDGKGGVDKNVFDIKTGVTIMLAIKKKSKSKKLAEIYRFDFLGSRENKFEFLKLNSVDNISWKKVKATEPNYEFVIRDNKLYEPYSEGFSANDLFQVSSVGIVTARDGMSIQFTKKNIEKVINDFMQVDVELLRSKYNLGKDVQDWKVNLAKQDVIKNFSENNFLKVLYRPLDYRWTFYTGNSKGFHCRTRTETMNHLKNEKNYALITMRQAKDSTNYNHVFISNTIVEGRMMYSGQGIISVFPLYLYKENKEKITNFNQEIYKKIIENIKAKVEPENVLDYIYTVLHSPKYREKYKEFLKIDFPRVPYPKNEKQFFALAKLGEELRHLHLMDGAVETRLIASLRTGNAPGNRFSSAADKTTYPVTGDNIIEKVRYDEKEQRVYINETQYFGHVPKTAWEFHIGGYQPAQKWLKDRKGRELSSDDIVHYENIIYALSETGRIMGEIDKIFVF